MAFLEYLRCYSRPGTIHAVCEDYQAAASLDKTLLAGVGHRITQPLMAIWGAKGTVGQLFHVLPMWRKDADDVTGQSLPCGHLIEEEEPDGLSQALGPFLQA